jgi:hypothetical protein
MEDARRFLRYVIPGLLFLIETFIYLILSSKTPIDKIMEDFIKGSSNNLALPISIFILSGGIGFLLSIIYHFLYWTFPFRKLVVNYIPLIIDCVNNEWLQLKNRKDESNINISALTQYGAWRAINAYLNGRKGYSERIKSGITRTDSLSDLLHGLGTSVIGSLLAIVMWVYFLINLPCKFYPTIFVILLSIAIFIIHYRNYRHVIKDFESIVGIIMTDEIKENFENFGEKTVIYLSEIDLDLKKDNQNKKSEAANNEQKNAIEKD